ncbi:hypothetical protein Dimus_005284 [Dionaea muscipula]
MRGVLHRSCVAVSVLLALVPCRWPAVVHPVLLNHVENGGGGFDKKKSGGRKFQVGKKKLKTKLTALAKAKAAHAMEVDK